MFTLHTFSTATLWREKICSVNLQVDSCQVLPHQWKYGYTHIAISTFIFLSKKHEALKVGKPYQCLLTVFQNNTLGFTAQQISADPTLESRLLLEAYQLKEAQHQSVVHSASRTIFQSPPTQNVPLSTIHSAHPQQSYPPYQYTDYSHPTPYQQPASSRTPTYTQQPAYSNNTI